MADSDNTISLPDVSRRSLVTGAAAIIIASATRGAPPMGSLPAVVDAAAWEARLRKNQKIAQILDIFRSADPLQQQVFLEAAERLQAGTNLPHDEEIAWGRERLRQLRAEEAA